MERRFTALGTPCSVRWSGDWVQRVEDAEARLGRRVCGAVAWDGGPCTLESEHRSGRCRFHGGHRSIGAPLGSANARVHGLYSRRLQRCGPECAVWGSCPMAGEDIEKLPPKRRPVCVYERAEYVELLKHYFKAEVDIVDDVDDMDESEAEGEIEEGQNEFNDDCAAEDEYEENEYEDCEEEGELDLVSQDVRLEFPPLKGSPEPYVLHQMIVLQVMLSRAAVAVAQGSLTDAVVAETEKYRMTSAKPSAALEAFIRLSREYRGLRGIIDTKKLIPPPQRMGLASRVKEFMKKAEGAVEEAIAETERQRKEEAERVRREEEKLKGSG